MKNVVFFISNQITQTQQTHSLVPRKRPNLPFSAGKVFAEILNFATGDLYSMLHH